MKQNDELLDLVNEHDQVIGTVLKSQVNELPNGLYRAIKVLVIDEKEHILLTQRSFTKTHMPGNWNFAAFGHVGAGEDPVDTARRELLEETGLILDLNFWYKHQGKNRFFYSYWAKYTQGQIVVQPEEVERYEWVHIDKLYEFSEKMNTELEPSLLEQVNKFKQEILQK